MTRSPLARLHFLLALATLLAPNILSAQTTAKIFGTVSDPSGAVLPGTILTVTHINTGSVRQVTADENGNYVVASLPVGEYTIGAELQGFKKKTLQGIVLQVNDTSRIDLALEVGATSETVTVTSEAPLIQSESAAVGQVIDNRFTKQIPLNGRDFSQLILLVPGANDSRSGGGAGVGSGVSIGGRDNANNFMIDGAPNNARQFGNIAIKPSIDVIQEFKVQSNLYSAEFGQAAFAQVNLVTKSGANEFHGSIFEFLRNDVFDARNFFLAKVPKLNRNQFGGSFGGPIKRNRSFFFVNYEGLRERRGVDVRRTVPIPEWRRGDFSGEATPIRDPLTGQPFSGNRIPDNRISPVAKAALARWPSPNIGLPGALTNNFLITNPIKIRDDQFNVRLDHEFSSRDRLSGRYSIDEREQVTTPSLPGFEFIDPPRHQNIVLSHTHVFTPRLLNEFKVAFTRTEFKQVSPNTGRQGFFGQFGINHQLAGPQFEGAPTFVFQRITMTTFGDGDFIPLNDISNEYNYADNLTYTVRSHTLKAGFTLTKYQQNTPGAVPGFRRGQFVFRGDFTGHPFADFLLGSPFQATRVVGTGVETGRSTWHGYYFNDDWKASKNLVLSFGVRYEYVSPLVDILNRRSVFFPLTNEFNTGLPGQIIVADSPEAGQLLGLKGIGRRALYDPDRNDWAPRFGFAYSFGQKTVVRGGYGIFYHQAQNFVNNFVINRRQPPFAETQVFLSDGRVPLNLSDPFSGQSAPQVISTQNINPHFRDGYVQQWNLTVQRELARDLVLEVGYVANKGTKLTELVFYNVPLPEPGPINPRRPFPQWGAALSLDSFVTSSYQSLQMKVQKRFSRGLSFLASYTYSKSIDISSERGSGDRAGIEGGNQRDLKGYFRGLSGFDVRNRFVLSYVYELPFGPGRRFLNSVNPVLREVVSGWQLSGITAFQSGFPFSVLLPADPANIGLGGNRPDRVRDGQLEHPTIDRWFDTDAFARPANPFSFGNSGRNILIGPGLRNWDLGVSKYTAIGERYRLQFRAEFFNLFNNVNFNLPGRTLGLDTFGRIDSAGRAREMQFGLKLEF